MRHRGCRSAGGPTPRNRSPLTGSSAPSQPDEEQGQERSRQGAVDWRNVWGCIGLLVLVTGGTGYVGSHSIAALASAGHRIRVLARSPERIPAALGPLGVDGVETAMGDVTEPAAVQRALEGCDAVLHAASVFSTDARKADEINAVNVRGTDVVLGAAHRLGLDPIVYVSSEVALLPPADGEVLTPDSPVQRPPGPYCRSKADAELVARRFQALGAPVVSVMPAAVWGPHDPHLGEGATMASNVLRNRYPVVMPGGMHVTDVRDVAAVLAAVVQPGRGPRSYLVAGHYATIPGIRRRARPGRGLECRRTRCPNSSGRRPPGSAFLALPSGCGRTVGRPTRATA
jgi:dihydroflavonol-4-reductase